MHDAHSKYAKKRIWDQPSLKQMRGINKPPPIRLEIMWLGVTQWRNEDNKLSVWEKVK